jgi:cytochrome c oxidase assembly protein subunit 15
MYIENKQLKNHISFWLFIMFWTISIMIVVGGLTRLTDSGLSITQWQLFSGFLPPITELQWLNYFNLYKEIPEFKLQNYSMNLQEFKVIFWWEWIHRFLGRLIGLFFLIPLIYFSFKTDFKNIRNLHLIFILICFQGFIGWYMVSSGLVERVDVSHFRLSIHLLIAFLILSLIFWNYLELKELTISKISLNKFIPIIFLILIFIQISIGAFVSGMDAGKIYNSWPLMGSSYFPNDSELINLFSFRSFSDPSLVQFMHRNIAYFIMGFYILILIEIYKKKMTVFFKIIKIIGFLLFVQIVLGILTLLNGAQIFLASMHQISSIFLVTSAIYFLYLNSNTN